MILDVHVVDTDAPSYRGHLQKLRKKESIVFTCHFVLALLLVYRWLTWQRGKFLYETSC